MLNPQAIQAVQNYLFQFAANDDFEDSIESIYGTKIGSATIRQQWLNRDFSLIPEIRVLSNGELGTASGAYAASLDKILVSSEFLAQYQDDVATVAGVLLEEVGHKLDRVLNGNVDTPGEEGAIFAAVAQGQSLSESQLQQLRSIDDVATIELDGVLTSVELATPSTTGSIGGGQSFDNRQPYAPHNYIIALQGIFPSRALSSEPFLGAVEEFAGNFAPRGWALCQGQLLPINTNSALFAILGTTYGGNGTTNFALPDLRGRIPVGTGTGPGLTPIALGEKGGQENVTLTTANLPAHSHTTSIPGVPTTENTGGGQSVDNRQPYLGLTPVIALEGIYPARNLGADEIIGGVSWFAGNFAPRGYEIADGRLLSIAENITLFSLLGTTYGGNGQTTFALPDLRGRTPIQAGQGPGLANILLGEKGGSDAVTLGVNSLPLHSHPIAGQANSGNTGGNVPFDNRQPYLGLNYEVSQFGFFPSQSLDDGSDPTNPGGVTGASGLVAGQEILSDEVALQKINNLARVGLGLWEAMGISGDQIATLKSATYKIANLDRGSLALVGADNVVTIDTDASNRGWFVDETPEDSLEYGTTDPITKELYATDAQALGHFDLLTAIVHEQGHILGFAHTSQLGSLMYGSLGTGGRRFPTLIDMVPSSPTDTSSPSLSGDVDTVAGVSMFAGTFAPRGFATADGQLQNIVDNTALFALLGTIYGGNGQTNFALPDYRGRVAVGMGQGPGLANYSLGQVGGAATTTLTINQIPAHAHSLNQPPAIRNDFNGDGKSDILWRNDFGSVALWQMNGATVTSGNLTSVPNLDPSWKVAGTGDFSGDGKADILWRNTNGNVAVWTMDGATVISSSLTSTPSLDNSWKTAGTGDFNGDGKSDILWRNTSGAVAVWTMNGSTVVSSSPTATPTLANSWKTAGTGDFNGDGNSDILWRNDDGSVALWQMNGANITASTLVSQLSSDWKINGTGDFNGDGKADILWRNDDGSVVLWQMNGANIISSSLTSTPSLDSSWKVAGVDDYNGDGKADILWRKDSGSLAVWQMNGSTVVSSSLTSIPADSNSWKIAAPIL